MATVSRSDGYRKVEQSLGLSTKARIDHLFSMYTTNWKKKMPIYFQGPR